MGLFNRTRRLKYLDLSDNFLTDIEASDFKSLQQLEYVYLADQKDYDPYPDL